ncbi:unnamed protein product [Sympodiomycopsis kandeliae]
MEATDPDIHPPERHHSKEPFYVDGKNIPGVSNTLGDLGPSFAGNIYTSPQSNNTLFFWLWPQKEGEPKNDENLIIWLNGGPGCSSLIGLLSENGPFKIVPGKEIDNFEARSNPWSWHRLSDIVWVEQPPPTGFATGPVTIYNDADGAELFRSWLHQFMDIFPEYRTRTITIIGESYGGVYLTYMYDALQRDGSFKLGGQGLVDAVIGPLPTQSTATVYPFYQEHNQRYLNISSTWMNLTRPALEKAGLTDEWYAEALKYPKTEHTPLPRGLVGDDRDELLLFYSEFTREANRANPCLNVYDISEGCPIKQDPLAYGPGGDQSWINNTPGFKEYIHAPANVTWSECSNVNPYLPPDDKHHETPDLADPFSGNIWTDITSKNRFVLMQGRLDGRLFHQGTEIVIQNTTWQGTMGFQKQPSDILRYDGERQGIVHGERNLTYALIDDCGHECPAYNPKMTFKLVQYILGSIGYEDLISENKERKIGKSEQRMNRQRL